MPVLNANDFIFVTLVENVPGKEDQPMIIGWNSREYTLAPGVKTNVILEAATNAFGDPRATSNAQAIPIGDPTSGERLFIPDRDAEIRRLRLRYGIDKGNDHTFEDENGVRRVPKVKMETMAGEELTPVLDDPTGRTINTQAPTVAETQDTNKIIAHLQKQVEELMKIVQDGRPSTDTIEELPEDEDIREDGVITFDPSKLADSEGFDDLPEDR